MYILVVYDIKTENLMKVHKLLRMYLTWIQNSVFEGEISKSQYNIIKTKIHELIDPEIDSVIIYEIPEKYLKKEVIGIEKNSIDFIL